MKLSRLSTYLLSDLSPELGHPYLQWGEDALPARSQLRRTCQGAALSQRHVSNPCAIMNRRTTSRLEPPRWDGLFQLSYPPFGVSYSQCRMSAADAAGAPSLWWQFVAFFLHVGLVAKEPARHEETRHQRPLPDVPQTDLLWWRRTTFQRNDSAECCEAELYLGRRRNASIKPGVLQRRKGSSGSLRRKPACWRL